LLLKIKYKPNLNGYPARALALGSMHVNSFPPAEFLKCEGVAYNSQL